MTDRLVYVDTSVALAWVFGEARAPAVTFWSGKLASSRLLEYEVWVRGNARGRTAAIVDASHRLFACVTLVALDPEILVRALDPFPVPLRTLDALHLATMLYLRDLGQDIALASYDERQLVAARALGVPVFDAG